MATPDWLTLNDQIVMPDRGPGQVPYYLKPQVPQDPADLEAIKAQLAAKFGVPKPPGAPKNQVAMPPASQVPAPNPMLSSVSIGSSFISPEDRAIRDDLISHFKQLVTRSEGGLDTEDQAIQDLKNQPMRPDLTPIAALADKWGGGGNQLTQAAQSMRGLSPEEKAQVLAKLQNMQDQSTEKLANTVGSRLSQFDATKMAAKIAEIQAKNALANSRTESVAQREASRIHNDSVLKSLDSSVNNLEQGKNILAKPTLTNQEFNDLQIELGNAISGARGLALGKLERTEYHTMQQKLADLKQQITGEPQDAVPEGIRKQFQDLFNHVYQKTYENRERRALSLARTSNDPYFQATQDQAISRYKAPAAESEAPAAPAGVDLSVDAFLKSRK